MRYLKHYESLFKKKEIDKSKENMKKDTYRFKDLHVSKSGDRMGTCVECGKVVDIADHDEEKCLKNIEEDL